MRLKNFIPFFIIFTSIPSLASVQIGSVTKLKGNVSILEIGHREAQELKIGQKVSRDASILTSEKSFVQITLLDKTTINLGPKSKIILDQVPQEKVGIVNLVMGAVRSEVIHKKENTKEKLYIKTRTAALGVRGTDFQTIYNPENKITSLITFEGKVALAKIKNEEQKQITKSDLEKAIIVEKGLFSTVSSNLKVATEPVKISPTQFTGLKMNKEMLEDKKIEKAEFDKEYKKTIEHYKDLTQNEKKLNIGAKRNYDADKATYRPTAGGVVDLNTGIYVPPTITKESFNSKLNIYEIKEDKGKVTDNGSYIPPAGTVLDSKKGFIATDSSQASTEKEIIGNLNQEISGQITGPKKPSKKDLENDNTDTYDKYFRID